MKQLTLQLKTERHYFQEGTELYEGEPGVEFGGEMRHIGQGNVDLFTPPDNRLSPWLW